MYKDFQPHELREEKLPDDQLGSAIALLALSGFMYGLYWVAPYFFEWLTRIFQLWGVRISITAGILMIAVGLFLLRQKRLRLYAAIELSFAIVTAWEATGRILSDPLAWPVLAAAAYLIVRGLDNWAKSRQRLIPNSGNEPAPIGTNPAAPLSTPQS